MSSTTITPVVNLMTSVKRPRTPSQSSTSSNSPPTFTSTHSLASPYSNHPPHKSTRIAPSSLSPRSIGGTSTSSGSTIKPATVDNNNNNNGGGTTANIPATRHPLLCTLPPTCHRHPTPIADTNDLERHYATYHAHVCGVKGCGYVFPDGRLLELHQTECHDPIASVRKERGDKIFQCHLPSPTCGRNFLTPKARRLHLIQAHAFPKEYFFAVTNKGVGGLLKKWGEGASLIRKEWRAREEKGERKEQRGVEGTVDMKNHRGGGDDGMAIDDDDDEEEDEEEDDESEEEEEEEPDAEATPRMLPRRTIGVHSPQLSSSSHPDTPVAANHNDGSTTNNKNDLTDLTESLTSLSLVPNSIRFGRGGKSGGFIPRGQGRGRAGKHSRPDRGGARVTRSDVMEVDVVPLGTGALGRGRVGVLPVRGRGRGRVYAPRANGRGRGT